MFMAAIAAAVGFTAFGSMGCGKGEAPEGRQPRPTKAGGTATRSGGDEQPAAAADEGGEVRSRTETDRLEPLEGAENVAAPVRYARTVVRARGYASDRLKEAVALKAVNMFKALEDRLPKSIEELNKWLTEYGDAALAKPDRGGVYHLDPKTGKIVIIDGP